MCSVVLFFCRITYTPWPWACHTSSAVCQCNVHLYFYCFGCTVVVSKIEKKKKKRQKKRIKFHVPIISTGKINNLYDWVPLVRHSFFQIDYFPQKRKKKQTIRQQQKSIHLSFGRSVCTYVWLVVWISILRNVRGACVCMCVRAILCLILHILLQRCVSPLRFTHNPSIDRLHLRDVFAHSHSLSLSPAFFLSLAACIFLLSFFLQK